MKNKNNITDELFKNFREKGHRLTTPRKAILSILSKTEEHPCVEDLYFAVHKSYPSIGITTVYRTLDLLVSWGVVHKFDFGEGKARYELISNPNGLGHHHHLICSECKKIINYSELIDKEVDLITKLEKRLSKKYNFNIQSHIIEFYGICKNCE